MAKVSIEKILENEENVASILPQQLLESIGATVCENYKKDKQSRTDWEDRSDEAMKLALQIAEQKNFPWSGAANIKYPLLTIAAIQFASRVDLFQGNQIVKGKVVGWDQDGKKQDRAIRIGRHMSYQLTEQIEDWEDDNDRMFHALPIIGSMFKKTYYDALDGYNCSELIWPRDLVFDYWGKRVESSFRKTHVLYLTPNELKEKINAGIFSDVDFGERPKDGGIPTGSTPPARPLAYEVEGTTPYQDEDAPREVYEQHTWWDLDGDGYKEPYIFVVDRDSEQVLRIVPRYDKSSIQRKGDVIVRIEADEYFTQFTFIPDPNGGNLGIGFGHLLGPGNEVVNTLINQLVDAGTLSNMQSGFIGSGIRIRGGEFRFGPGEWKRVNSTGEDLNRNIVPLPVREPSDVLFQLLNLMISAGEKIGSVTDAIVGENPPTNQPATTTLSVIEQGLKVFKRIHKRLYRSFTKEFKKLYTLNKRYLDPQTYFEVLDIPMQEFQKLLPQNQQVLSDRRQLSIALNDYRKDDTDVIPSADPNVMTDIEKMKKVEALLQTMALGWNPEVIKKRFVEAMEFANPDELLAPAPPPPPDPKIVVAQMQAQLQQAQLQQDGQLKSGELQLKQMQMQLDGEKARFEIDKIKMEISKIDAEIRQIFAEIGSEDEEMKGQIEIQKLGLEREIKGRELQLKEKELQMKGMEMQMNMQGMNEDRQLKREEMKYKGNMEMTKEGMGMALEKQKMSHENMMTDKEMSHDKMMQGSEQKHEGKMGKMEMEHESSESGKDRKHEAKMSEAEKDGKDGNDEEEEYQEIKRGKSGLIDSVGKRKIVRDKSGRAIGVMMSMEKPTKKGGKS